MDRSKSLTSLTGHLTPRQNLRFWCFARVLEAMLPQTFQRNVWGVCYWIKKNKVFADPNIASNIFFKHPDKTKGFVWVFDVRCPV